jgi:hypothetical protein
LRKGVKLNFDLNYVFDDKKTLKDLKAAENLLTFNSAPDNDYENDHISKVFARSEKKDGYVRSITGNTGVIYGSGKNSATVLHESLHLLGLSDRYDDFRDNNLFGAGRYVIPHKGFEHDIMGNSELKLNKYHYERYRFWGEAASKVFKSDVIPLNRKVDRNPNGALMTPYEPNRIHYNQMADNN